ncbi:MAG: tetratricopeptide repeat protein [Phycisphaerales bacterium]|nr:tetratricopeptide repeat protein [Phycisphaerales bacterium]
MQTDRTRRAPSCPRCRAYLGAIALGATLLAGCAGPRDARPSGEPPHPAETTHGLLDPALDRPENLRTARADVPPPPPLDQGRFSPGDDDAARMELAAVIDHFAALGLPELHSRAEPPASGEPAAESDSDGETAPLGAIHAYAAARLAMLSGSPRDARQLLAEVLRRDERSAPAWELLGDASIALGNRVQALGAYEQVLLYEPENAHALMHVGTYLVSIGRNEQAARLLSIAARGQGQATGRQLAPLIHEPLGRCLDSLGYLTAATAAYQRALDLPPSLVRSAPRYSDELADIYRRRPELLRAAGDLELRLGRPKQAFVAFSLAAELPGLPSSGLLDRQLWAALRAGRPASAANLLLTDITADPTRIREEHITLCAYLRTHTTLGPRLADALRAIIKTHGETVGLNQAVAASLDSTAAKAYLLGRLLDAPSETPLLAALLERSETRTGLLILTARVIDAHPDREGAYSSALLDVDEDAGALVATLEAMNLDTLGAGLLHLRLLIETNRVEQARAQHRMLAKRFPDAPAITLAHIRMLNAAGRFAEALTQLDRSTVNDAQHLRARVEALRGMQFFREALVAGESLLATAGSTPGDRLTHADLLAALRRHQEQEALLSDLLATSDDEGAYDRLIVMYGRRGPLPDPDRFRATVRRLHDRMPTSRTLRMLLAEEDLAEQRFDAVERVLTDLVIEDPTDERASRMLAEVWAGIGAERRGAAWLEETIEQTRETRSLVLALGKLYSLTGRPEHAAAVFERFLAQHGDDERVQRLHETALRQGEREEEAQRLAIERTSATPRSHRTIDATLTLAGAQLHALGRELPLESVNRDAALHALEAIDPRVILTEPQCRLASRLLLALAMGHSAERQQGELNVSARELAVAERLHDASLWPEADVTQPYLIVSRLRLSTLLLHDEPGQAVALLRSFRDDGRLRPVSAAMLNQRMATDDLADVIYFLTLLPDLTNATGEALLQAAIDENPDHVMANNDLGYGLIDRDERLEEGEALIERAHALNPTDANIIDSLGWARYKLGVFEDEVSETGRVVRRGAISLLHEAAAGSETGGYEVVADHLGDSLWRAKRYDEALQVWISAYDGLLEEEEGWRKELRDRLRLKIAAAQHDQTPAVATSPGADAVREADDAGSE